MPSTEQVDQVLPITFFSVIRLKHKETGRYLCSIPKKYSHKNGSDDQFIVGTEEKASDRSLWMVRPMHLLDYQCAIGERIGLGVPIRLENVKLRTNLHSHKRVAPKSGNQFEVTTFGKDGFCNKDDNWRFSNAPGTSGGLVTNSEVTLQHAETGFQLHSHNVTLELEGDDLNEVTGFPNQDVNDIWIISDVLPPPEKIVLHPFLSMPIDGLSLEFKTVDDVGRWLNEERAATEWAWSKENTGANSNIASLKSRYIGLINEHSQVASTVQNPERFYPAAEQFRAAMLAVYGGEQLILTTDSKFIFIQKWKDRDHTFAANLLAHFTRLPVSDIREEMRAAFEAIAFTRGLAGFAESELDAIKDVKSKLDAKFKESSTVLDSMTVRMQSAFDQAQKRIESNDALYREVFDDGRKNMEGIKKAFEQEFALKASVEYWSAKVAHHKFYSIVFAIAAMVAAVIAIIGLCVEIRMLLHDAGQTPPWWKLGVLLILATFSIWFVRIIVQLFQSHIHLEGDARERVTMIQTYLAMLKEQVGPEKDHRLLILQTLFRPASTGIIKDDAAPATWLEILVSKLGAK